MTQIYHVGTPQENGSANAGACKTAIEADLKDHFHSWKVHKLTL